MTEPTAVRAMEWTGEQAAAIRASGHTLLTASAGTGKTTTVIGKILWHLGLEVGINGDTGRPIPPCPTGLRCELHEIAAITFTEKAAHDLKRKLRDEIRRHDPEMLWEIDRAAIGTIHGFCADLLREHALRLGIDPTFRVLDEREARIEQDAIIKEIVMGALQREDGDGPDPGAVELVKRFKLEGWGQRQGGVVELVRKTMWDLRWHPGRYDAFLNPGADEPRLDLERLRAVAGECWSEKDSLSDRFCEALYRLARRALEEWRRYQEVENVRDFDSLILDARGLLTGEAAAAALASLQARYRLLIIDEFQDTDAAQWEIAAAIAGLDDGAGPQLFLVGDPKQSIYGFRGADIAVWNRARQVIHGDDDPPELSHNFRSDPWVVGFVNRAGRSFMDEVAGELSAELPESRVHYSELAPARPDSPSAEVEWLEVQESSAADRRDREAERVAARIRDIVYDEDRGDTDGIEIVDPDSPPDAPHYVSCRYRHVAILFRSRTGIERYEAALREYRVPYYLTGDAGFNERQEILDCLTLLRLLEDPGDDLRAFAYLRSPFVGLRDEAIARIRLEGQGSTLLRQARDHLENGEPWPATAAEARAHGLDPRVVGIERRALALGLATIDELSALRSRLPLDRLLEEALDRTGYRLHLFLTESPEPALANIGRFIGLLESYRDHTVGTFLEIWDAWKDRALGIPQAPLYSADDDVVTLSTVHSAKGLEWPVVFLVDNHEERASGHLSNEYWSDREYGPVLCLKQGDRGDRGDRLRERAKLEATAEEARVLYVAATRARDRLIVAGPTEDAKGAGEWLSRGLDDSVGRTRELPKVEIPASLPEPELDWLDDIEPTDETRPLTAPLRRPKRRWIRSATELMARDRSPREWRLRYWHGVTPVGYFAPEPGDGEGQDNGEGEGEGIPAALRGTLIHGVLERIREEAELAELLDETIGALDSPELEERLAAGTEYRAALEEEIRAVVASEAWAWYTEGVHYRELDFVQLRGPRNWRVGAFDLYRPRPGDESWIIDFKTHEIEADEVETLAREYRLQGRLYRAAAVALDRDAGGRTRVRLHFTRPNRATEL